MSGAYEGLGLREDGEEHEESGEGVGELHGCRDGWRVDAKLASGKASRPSVGWRPAAVCAVG